MKTEKKEYFMLPIKGTSVFDQNLKPPLQETSTKNIKIGLPIFSGSGNGIIQSFGSLDQCQRAMDVINQKDIPSSHNEEVSSLKAVIFIVNIYYAIKNIKGKHAANGREQEAKRRSSKTQKRKPTDGCYYCLDTINTSYYQHHKRCDIENEVNHPGA